MPVKNKKAVSKTTAPKKVKAAKIGAPLEAAAHAGMHAHVDAAGNVYYHTHNHTHTHENTKAVINRLSRAIGHLNSVKTMVKQGRDCSEVLIQLAAVRAAINRTCDIILQDHIDHCIVDAVKTGDTQAIEELNKALKHLMK
jgi:DNA-binding FrmR family transcriptional regulator